MICPSCKSQDLKATKLDNDLPVQGCSKCGGVLISLLYYREWAERTINNEPAENLSVETGNLATHESHTAMNCPKCAKLMTKFNISGATKNRIDLCTHCDEAWLDGGEWELLKALHLSKEIPSIFTDPWQRKVRKEISDIRLKERFEKIVGEADINKAEEIRNWIKSHKKRAELLFYIGQE